MSWQDVMQAYRALQNQAQDPLAASLRERWASYRTAVFGTQIQRPFHLRILLEELDNRCLALGVEKEEMSILDHGCGGGMTVLYLIALGYRGARGVDIGSDDNFCHLNRIAMMAGATDRVFTVYDGHKLPFQTESVDFIYSNQVIEHVSEKYIDAYFSEERRILKYRGIALHQIPHRLTPYDSHTRTWCIHYLPYGLRNTLYALSGHDPAYVERILSYRWPWFHRRMLRHYFGSCRDITLRRLTVTRDFNRAGEATYDGSFFLRRLIDLGANARFLRPALGPLIAQFVMLELIAEKV